MSKQQGELDLRQFKDQIAVITGAGNNGIGWGIAKHAALELGMHVVLVDLHMSVVDKACAQLRELAPDRQIVGVQCDVTKIEELEKVAQVVNEEVSDHAIGMVFANAGVIFNKTILNSPLEDWKTTLDVNVIGVVATAKFLCLFFNANRLRACFAPPPPLEGLCVVMEEPLLIKPANTPWSL